jgi:winged helix DNA-binding protein
LKTTSPSIDVARERLRNQRLVGAPFAKPEDAVRWLGAVQAQDYAGAKWALGQRTKACRDADVEQACRDGRILRTHVLRPTWHFVLPDDIRWLLALTAPRVRAAMAYYDRKLALDDGVFRRSQAAIGGALSGGKALTREELGRVLAGAGIEASGQRLGHIMMRAELDALIVSGPRRGKQFTYALLDERAPPGRRLAGDEALAELAGRYFASHGPAQPQDFAWWSGLTVGDAKRGIDAASPRLASAMVDGRTFWFAPGGARRRPRAANAAVHLLPNYDEVIVAYRDHRSSLAPGMPQTFKDRPEVVANHLIAVDGRIVGGWRRIEEKGAIVAETMLPVRLGAAQGKALRAAASRLQTFLGLPVQLRARKMPAS